jgi:hypothetical protein
MFWRRSGRMVILAISGLLGFMMGAAGIVTLLSTIRESNSG